MQLADLCDLVATHLNPVDRPDDLYVGLEHIASGRFVRQGEGRAADVHSAKHAFQPGDVLYGKLRPYLDKAVLVSDAGICTTELLVLRPKEGVDPRFVVGVVHMPGFVQHAVAGTTGVQHPRTSWRHISSFELPDFSSDEQTKIAKLSWQVHDAITANEATVDAGSALKRTAMQELFMGGLRNEVQKDTEIGTLPKNWKPTPFSALFDIVQGFSLKRNLSENGQGVPFLRTSNVYWGRLELNTMSHMRIDPESIGDRDLQEGDLLVCEGGEIGRAAVWEGKAANTTFQNHLHRLRPLDPGRIVPKFAMFWLEEGFLHRGVYEGAGNRTTIPNLSRARLGELSMPVPNLDEQREIVTILEAIDRKIDLHRRKRAVLDDLFKALLHKLMTGEIRVSELDLSVLQSSRNSTRKRDGINGK